MECLCDNMAVVVVVNSGRAKDRILMHLLRSMFFIAAHWNIHVHATHLPGVENERSSGRPLTEQSIHFSAGSSRGSRSPNTNPGSSGGYGDLGTTGLAVPLVGPTLQRLLQAGLAAYTQRAYMEGKRKYLTFCQESGMPPLPVTEQKLSAFGVNQGLKHQTVKCYLSAVRHLQISSGGGDPRVESMPVLQLVLRGGQEGSSLAIPHARGYPLPRLSSSSYAVSGTRTHLTETMLCYGLRAVWASSGSSGQGR